MVFEEPDEGGAFRRPPSFEDRLWRHPSELGPVELPAGDTDRSGRPSSGRIGSVWMAALTSALGASLMTAGIIMVFLGRPGEPSAVSPLSATTAPSALSMPDTDSEPVVAVTQRLWPSIVKVTGDHAGGERAVSGVIFHSDGFVLTSAQALEGTEGLQARLADGTLVGATVVGTDPATDTAVVRLQATTPDDTFPAAPLGSTAELQVGQLAMVIGASSIGAEPAVAVGVVSAIGEPFVTFGGRVLLEMIHTDARLPAGVSGGAVVDRSGSLIGIAVSAQGPDGSILSLALPVEVATVVASQLMEWGAVSRSWMGIDTADLDQARRHALGIAGGALIVDAHAAGPAAQAGVQAGDVVVGIDGDVVASAAALVAEVGRHRPGETVTLDLIRDGRAHSAPVTLGRK